MSFFAKLLDKSWLMFGWRYFRRQTPWDTDITPPEVMEFIAGATPGRALDLGCGTGTNAITLASHGWDVTGVDFIPRAIRTARKKAAGEGFSIDFRVADVAELGMLAGHYAYALDIGCLFSLPGENRKKYAGHLERLVETGGIYMLYAWLPRPWKGKTRGMAPEEVERLFTPAFSITDSVIGEENGFPTGWYWFEKA